MKKHLIVLLALVVLLNGVFLSATRAEELSLFGGMLALSGLQNQITPGQEQELTAIMEYLGQDLTEENALDEFMAWDKDKILQKLEGYDVPLEYFESKEQAAGFIADVIAQILSIFRISEEQLQEQAGGLIGGMDGLFDFSFEDDPYIGVAIDGAFNSTYWESGTLKLTAVWQDGYYKILIQDGEQEWIYLCEEDAETGDKIGIGTGDPDQTEAQEDHGLATFCYRYENNEEHIIWQKADGSSVIFDQIFDPLDETQWYREGMMLTLTWRGENAYGVQIDGYGLPDYSSWYYECILDENRDALVGTGEKTVFVKAGYTDAQAVFTFSEGRTMLTWTDDREESAREGLLFEGVDKTLTNEVWELEEKYAVQGAFADGFYIMTVIEIGTDPTIEYQYLCTYDRTESILTAVDPSEVDLETIMNHTYLDLSCVAGSATFEMLDDEQMLWKEATGMTGDEGLVLTLVP